MYKAIVKRIVDLVKSPQTEWVHIEEENRGINEIQNSFFYPLVAAVILGTVLGDVLGFNDFSLARISKETIIVLTSTFAGYFIAVTALNEIIASRLFNMEKQYVACVRLIAYSSSIMLCIRTVVAIVPDLFILYALNFYTAYIIWEGSGVIIKGLEENRRAFFMVICLVLLYVSPFLVGKLMDMMMR